MPGASTASPPAPHRRLGLSSAAALVIANMIGSGVFTTSGFALADHGRPDVVLLAWVVGGALAMCGALCYGALARRIPHSGGEYTFLTETIHPLPGFLAGWVSLLAGFTAPIAAAALLLQAYLASSVFGLGRPEWTGTAAILIATAMHGPRLREGVWIQNLAIGLKLVAIVFFLAVGLGSLPAAEARVLPAFEPGAFAVTLVWISFSYSGWNAAVYIASEVRDPERNLARSLVLGTGLVTLLYVGLNAVFLYAAPVEALAGRPEIGAVAAEALGGPTLKRVVALLIALALFTSVSSMMMIGPRVYARMAEDGRFPRWFSNRGEAPTRAVLLQAALSICVVWISDLRELLGYIGFTLGLSAAATVVGLLLLRRREGPERVPIPGYPWVPLIFVVATLWFATHMALREPAQAGIGLLTAASGIPFYYLTCRRSRSTDDRLPPPRQAD